MKYRCNVCGYIHNGPNPPQKCPVCKADRRSFQPLLSISVGEYFKFLQPGWWLLHFLGIALVYTLGNLLWH